MNDRRLYLYGGFADNFAAITTPFIAAAGGEQARIALLFPGGDGWERFVGRYRDPWLQLGAATVTVVVPGPNGELSPESLTVMADATGIFMGGGDTRVYHRLYAQGEARALIRERYGAGVPYGGVSAGALLVPDLCSIWGDRLTKPHNTLQLRGSEEGCEAELLLGEGLGLLRGFLVEAHFAELGGFPRLVAAMEEGKVGRGLGFDDPICVEVLQESVVRVHGRGRAYLLRQQGEAHLQLQVLEPGQEALID